MLTDYNPQLIIVSAGFDAHWIDPLATLSVSLSGFHGLVRQLIETANHLCDGKIVFVMEGGYDLPALSHENDPEYQNVGQQPTAPPETPPAEPVATDTTEFLDSFADDSTGIDVDFGAEVDAEDSGLDFLDALSDDASAEPVTGYLTTDSETDDFLNSLGGDISEDVEEADLSWLNELGADVSDDLPDLEAPSFEDMMSGDEELPEAIEATHTQEALEGSIDGLSDAELEAMRARGELSGAQELACIVT